MFSNNIGKISISFNQCNVNLNMNVNILPFLLILQNFPNMLTLTSLLLALSIWINLWPDVAMAQGKVSIHSYNFNYSRIIIY